MLENLREIIEKNNYLITLAMMPIAAFFFLKVEVLPDFSQVIGKIILIFCFVQIPYELLKKKWKKLKLTDAHIAMSLLLIFTLLPPVLYSNKVSTSFTLSVILIMFAFRYLLYNFYLLSWRKQKQEEIKKIENASFASYMIIYFIFSSLIIPIGLLSYKIAIVFLVYAIYDFIKIKYLPSIYTEKNTSEKSKNAFSAISDVDSIAWLIVLFLFMLYSSNIFNFDRQTLYYFYSSTAQVFSALLGIVVMFGILIIQDKRKSSKIDFLKSGLIGFSLLYIVVIILSLTGILVVNDIFQESDVETFNDHNPINIQNMIDMGIYEMTFLMIPVSLLYLYALVTDFLKSEFGEKTEQTALADYND